MNQDPVGRRRGGLRIWVLVLFALYAGWYWYSNRSVDPLTGEAVVIDRGISPEQEKALGLQAYREVLRQERPLPADSQAALQVREIADRLIERIPEVSDALAAEHGMQVGAGLRARAMRDLDGQLPRRDDAPAEDAGQRGAALLAGDERLHGGREPSGVAPERVRAP